MNTCATIGYIAYWAATGTAISCEQFVPAANGGFGISTVATGFPYDAAGTWSIQSAAAHFAALSPLTTLGDILYENSTPTPARLAGNITAVKNFLCQTGTGTLSAAPAWCMLAATDLPAATTSALGAVKTDGSTISNSSGLISCTTATASQMGCSEPDGTTLTVATGKYSIGTMPAQAHPIVILDMSNTAYAASQLIITIPSPVAGKIPVGGTGTYNAVACSSYFNLTTNPAAAITSSSPFTLNYNGTQFGYVTFTTGGVATISITAQLTVAAGGIITVKAPSTPDTAAAGLTGSLCFAY